MKKYIYPMALAATALFATACSDDESTSIVEQKLDSQKEMISLSVGLDNGSATPTTRAMGSTIYSGFTGATRILMRIQSDNSTTEHLYTRTLVTAAVKAEGKDYSNVSQDDAYKRYWDDAFGRNAHLSIFAVAIADKTSADLLPETSLKGSSSVWETSANDNKITWEVNNSSLDGDKKIQTPTDNANQDLIYSNNIKDGSTVGGRYVWNFNSNPQGYVPNIDAELTGTNVFTSGQMQFECSSTTDNTAPGKFDKGHLVFNHALSRITVTIKNGTGFGATNFTLSDAGIQIIGMATKGDLDVSTGTWDNKTTSNTIVAKPTKATSTSAASYTATMQMLPDYVFTDGDATTVIKFTIDNNEYYVTQDMIFDALKSGDLTDATGSITMLQGKNYKFTITINKAKIDNLTASVAAWTNVTAADQELHNSYITISAMKDLSGSSCNNFDIYRMAVVADKIYTDQTSDKADNYENYVWGGNYADKVTPTWDETNSVWKTAWVFEDNKTFYHFRTVNKNTTVSATDTEADDYFTITSGAVADTDPHWGAPMKSVATLTYDAEGTASTSPKGYGDNIYKAIGSTESAIKIQELHMMSKIQIILKTVSGAAAVNLYDNNNTTEDTSDDKYPEVTLTNFAKTAKVLMGNGLVTANTDYETGGQLITTPTTGWSVGVTQTREYSWCVVPQLVKRGDGAANCIGITIKTPDNNQYYIIEDLSAIKVDGESNAITRWLPNHTYTYTFILSKKGIETLTCSVAEWVTVTAADTPIDLEK